MRRGWRGWSSAGPADPTGLRAFIFGDRGLDEWPPSQAGAEEEPWRSFVAARAAIRAGDRERAGTRWLGVATMTDVESRQVLQAWHFLRGIGITPPPEEAKTVHGAVAEVAVGSGHDLLAAYADGSVRYLNFSGAAAVIEQTQPAVEPAASELLRIAGVIAQAIGPWEGAALPALPTGHSRLTVLTPSGPHLGQGPDAALRADPMAGAFLEAATALLVAVTDLPRSP